MTTSSNPMDGRSGKIDRGWVAILSIFALGSVFIANRAASKVGIGPIYLVDLLVAINILYVTRVVVRRFSTYKYPAFILTIALCWLVYEYVDGAFGQNNLRRFAMAVYLFVPALIHRWGNRFYASIERNPLRYAIAVSILTVGEYIPNLSPTISAQVLAFLALIVAFHGKSQRWVKLAVIICLFGLVASGYTSDGAFYRTPVVGLLVAIIGSLSIRAFTSRKKKRRLKSTALLFCGMLLLSTALVAFSGHPVVSQFVSGAAGLLGIDRGSGMDPTDRVRGDSLGTAETRVVFWEAIWSNSLTSPTTFIFGNGHAESFFEKTQPYEDFVDSDVLEPHNSFMGLFYRYGFLGLVFLILFLWRCARISLSDARRADNLEFSVAVYLLALVFCFFDVVLESPHGAVVFWLLWMSPQHFGDRQRVTRT